MINLSLSRISHVPFIFFLVLFSTPNNAQNTIPGKIRSLASEPEWLKLEHYELDRTSTTGWRSTIHSSDFFLARDGRNNPATELQATIRAFNEALKGEPDTHAKCRFPARWLWLKLKLNNNTVFQHNNFKCPAYDRWKRSGNITSISIVFVTGYLGNPASYFGHTLLKFNSKGDNKKTPLMDVSVNFGAILDKHDDPVTYIFKSVSGGYEAGFSHIHFYFHEHNYGDNELRDMWEYQLDLPQEAVNLIVAHSWEVLGKRYNYGFFRDNCAFRMAELLEIIDGITITPDRTPWIIPQALIEKIGVSKYHGRPILKKVRYLPSRQSRFYEKYLSLSTHEKIILKNLAEEKTDFSEQKFRTLTSTSKQEVLDTLMDYYQFVGSPWALAKNNIKEKYTKALSKRYQLPPGKPSFKKIRPTSPHLARPIGWAQSAWVYNSTTGNSLSLRIRPAYYDSLDADSGNVKNSSLVIADLQLNISHDRAYIQKLDLVGIDSASSGLTNISGDGKIAWKLHIGAEQARLACGNCLIGRLEGDYGLGRQWSGNLFGAIYIGAAIQNRWTNQGLGFARTSATIIIGSGKNLKMRATYEQRFPIDGNHQGSYGVTGVEARWSIANYLDIRLNYIRDRAEQVSLGAGLYW